MPTCSAAYSSEFTGPHGYWRLFSCQRSSTELSDESDTFTGQKGSGGTESTSHAGDENFSWGGDPSAPLPLCITSCHHLKVPSDYKLPTIYFLPKIHKHPLKLRPNAASFKSITPNVSWFLNVIPQTHMKRRRSYCKNATHIANI